MQQSTNQPSLGNTTQEDEKYLSDAQLKNMRQTALQEVYGMIEQNKSERSKTMDMLDEEMQLIIQNQGYSFLEILASVLTLGLYSAVKEACDELELEELRKEKKEVSS